MHCIDCEAAGTQCKRQKGQFLRSAVKDPRMEWAAYWDSEVPLSGGAGAEGRSQGCCWKHPSWGVENCLSWAAVLFLRLRVFDADACAYYTLELFGQTRLSTF